MIHTTWAIETAEQLTTVRDRFAEIFGENSIAGSLRIKPSHNNPNGVILDTGWNCPSDAVMIDKVLATLDTDVKVQWFNRGCVEISPKI